MASGVAGGDRKRNERDQDKKKRFVHDITASIFVWIVDKTFYLAFGVVGGDGKGKGDWRRKEESNVGFGR